MVSLIIETLLNLRIDSMTVCVFNLYLIRSTLLQVSNENMGE